VDDTAPEFTSQQYNFNVSENVNVGDIVGQVVANDPDQGTVSYALGQDVRVPFIIDQRNPGNIVVNAVLNRERVSMYTFGVSDQ